MGQHAAGSGLREGRPLDGPRRGRRAGSATTCASSRRAPRGDLYATTFDGKILRRRGDRLRGSSRPPADAQARLHAATSTPRARSWVIHPQFIGMFGRGRLAGDDPCPQPIGGARGRDRARHQPRRRPVDRHPRLPAQVPRRPARGAGHAALAADRLLEPERGLAGRGLDLLPQGRRLPRVTRTAIGGTSRPASGLTYHAARFVFEDREGNHWIGTSGGGLLRFKRRHFVTWGQRPGPARARGEDLSVDRRGRIAIGTHGQGVVWLEDGRFRRRPGRSVDAPAIVPLALATLVDRQDRLWVGSLASGLFVVEGGSYPVLLHRRPARRHRRQRLQPPRGLLRRGLDRPRRRRSPHPRRRAPLRRGRVPHLQAGGITAAQHRALPSPRAPTAPCGPGTHAGGLYRLEGDRFVPVPEARALRRRSAVRAAGRRGRHALDRHRGRRASPACAEASWSGSPRGEGSAHPQHRRPSWTTGSASFGWAPTGACVRLAREDAGGVRRRPPPRRWPGRSST